MRWLGENEAFLEKNYAGKWVAVKGDQLIAAGDSANEAVEAALERGVGDPVVAPVKSKEYQGVFLIRTASRT